MNTQEMQQKEFQRQQEKVIADFGWPSRLKLEGNNLILIGGWVGEHYANIYSPESLRAALEALRTELDWDGPVPDRIVLRGEQREIPMTREQKLALLGIRVEQRRSHTDRSEQEKKDSQWDELRRFSQLKQQRQELIAAREAAKSITDYYESGKICWATTDQKRAEATERISRQIQEWNAKVKEDLRIN